MISDKNSRVENAFDEIDPNYLTGTHFIDFRKE